MARTVARKLSAQIDTVEHEIVIEPASDPVPGAANGASSSSPAGASPAPNSTGAGATSRWRILVGPPGATVERLVDARRLEGGAWSLLVDGRQWIVDVDPHKDGLLVEVGGTPQLVKLVDPRRRALTQAAQRPKQSGPESVRAPMPGKVVKLLVAVGDKVTVGQGLIVVEAMKMENELKAPRDGVVKELKAKEGQTVESQEPLIVLD